ncbi:MAG: putative glycosidase [Acidimicrobiales bacterium]|nr:putative glycosidase [Acidimicrobiales bacterium]
MVDLTGTWRAAVADEELRRSFADRDAGDDGWEGVPVPAHWRHTPAFADSDGPLLYRRRFESGAPADGERAWLVLDGLFYQGDVWLDGTYLGDTEGYFVRHTFEVTEPLGASAEHLLAVEVTCHPQTDRTAKRNITGMFQHPDADDPGWNPGGIWRPVRIERTGPVRARSLRVLCLEASTERAVVAFRAELDSDAARTVRLCTDIGGQVEVTEHPVAEGSNFVEWTATVANPALWWPHALGDQPMADVTVEVQADGVTSHSLERRIGLRTLRWKDWMLSVNGERLFLKGANQGPTRLALADATPDELRRDVTLAREAGLDLLRLHGHITRPELYDAADELGILLWQDLPLRHGYSRTIRKQAIRQAAAAVDLLGHHPSVAIWCWHDTPVALHMAEGKAPTSGGAVQWALRQELPTWNKTFLDRSVKRAIEKSDGTRPVIAHSGVVPHPGGLGTDSHLWFGWFHGEERDLPGFARAFPRMVRFVSGLGAKSVPAGRPTSWPDIDDEVLARRVPPGDFATEEEWTAATRTYQASVVKHHVETLRRLKYRPTGGFSVSSFGDTHPAVSWAVLDHHRNPKPAYFALIDACRPVIVVADRLPATVRPGETLALDVHVVSDLRQPLGPARVDAALSWPSGSHDWHWEGEVPADGCVRVGTLQAVVPDEPGELILDLAVHTAEQAATNRYTAVISAP